MIFSHMRFRHPLHTTAGGVASVGERVTFSSPDENARTGETAPKFQCQPTLAAPLVSNRNLFSHRILLFVNNQIFVIIHFKLFDHCIIMSSGIIGISISSVCILLYSLRSWSGFSITYDKPVNPVFV